MLHMLGLGMRPAPAGAALMTEYAVATDREDHLSCCKSIYVGIRCASRCMYCITLVAVEYQVKNP